MERSSYYDGGSSRLKSGRSNSGSRRTTTTTPYDRPSVGRHASARPQQAAAIAQRWSGSAIVGSASRMLTKGAAYLFTSFFKRQAPAITAPGSQAALQAEQQQQQQQQQQQPQQEQQQHAEVSVSEELPPLEVASEVELRDDGYTVDHGSGPDANNIADLENILRHKKLTREQCKRYIELVESKLAEKPVEVLEGGVPGENSNEVARPYVDAVRHEAPMAVIPYECTQAPWERNERPSEPQIHRSLSSRWTPLRSPITGGPELLKNRASVTDDKPVISARRSTHTLYGRTSQGNIDLSCFRKERKMAGPVKILGGVDKATPVQLPPVRQTNRLELRRPKGIDAKRSQGVKRGSEGTEAGEADKAATSSQNTGLMHKDPIDEPIFKRTGTVNFTFPSIGTGSEPPTPQPMGSPVADEKGKSRNLSRGILKNGLISSSTLLSNGTDLAARADRASTLLNERLPSLTPSSSVDKSVKPEAITGNYISGKSLCDGACSSGTCGTATKQESLFRTPLGTQSLAPPDSSLGLAATTTTTAGAVNNGGFSLGSGGKLKKKAKRIRL